MTFKVGDRVEVTGWDQEAGVVSPLSRQNGLTGTVILVRGPGSAALNVRIEYDVIPGDRAFRSKQKNSYGDMHLTLLHEVYEYTVEQSGDRDDDV